MIQLSLPTFYLSPYIHVNNLLDQDSTEEMNCSLAGEKKVGKKREAKNERYGFGGRKRLGKQNDATSAADMDGFRQGKFNDGYGGRCCADMQLLVMSWRA